MSQSAHRGFPHIQDSLERHCGLEMHCLMRLDAVVTDEVHIAVDRQLLKLVIA